MTAQDLPAQLSLVLSREIAVHPADAEDDFEYLYRTDRVLTRTEDVAEVRAALAEILRLPEASIFTDNDTGPVYYGPDQRFASDQDGERVPTVPPGLTRLGWQGQSRELPLVPDLLDRLEGSLVAEKVTPEHFLYVCGHCCAGTEPELPTKAGTVPSPPASTGCGDGAQVTMRIYDTGLAPSGTAHSWMAGVTGDPDRSVRPGPQGPRLLADGGHGTFVAGCARVEAAAVQIGITDMATRAPNGGFTIGVAAEADLAARLVGDPKADIIVFSYAGPSRGERALLAFRLAWDLSLSKRPELTIVAPAGNDSQTRPFYPAAFPWVVGVGALTADGGAVAGFSNRGSWVDVYAPGEDAVNAFATGTYDYRWPSSLGGAVSRSETFAGLARWSGTSFSAPMVAGQIAARMSARQIGSQEAWAQLQALAQEQASAFNDPDVKGVLLPGQGCDEPRAIEQVTEQPDQVKDD